jgi:hypothetical protein
MEWDIIYSSDTEFLVQVGRGAKGSYKTRYSLNGGVGSLTKALMYYHGINIGNGYKKRLVMSSKGSAPSVLARSSS